MGETTENADLSAVASPAVSNEDLVQTYKENIGMMKTIAGNCQSLDDIKMLTSSKVQDQLKVFLVAQARNELNRVIKLTEFLDKLESSFMTKANQYMMDDSLTLKQYSDIISVITSLLSRSNDIIYGVLKDDSLMTILNTTIYSSDNGETTTTSVAAQLKDPQSRERVRAVISQIIYKAENYDKQQGDVIQYGD